MKPLLNYIGGSFVPADSAKTLENINPATNEVITTIPRSSSTDVNNATVAAINAEGAWKATTFEDRIRWLDRIADALEAKAEQIAQLETMDTGKPISLSRRVDAARSVSNFRFFANYAREQEPMEFEAHGAINYVHRSPVGCVGLITPWNLPLYLLTWKVAPALLMGNTIVAKPSEMTPMTANLLAETLDELN